MKKFLEAGKIVGTHGLNGSLKVQPWCDSAETLCSLKELYFDEGKQKVDVLSSRENKGNVIMNINGIDTIEKAISVRGSILYLDRNDLHLDEGTFFIQDIIGCEVLDSNTKELYGKVTDVFKTGANDVYQVSSGDKNVLVPVIPDVIDNVNVDEKKIFITPLVNLFD